jgi:hypothetical protein
LTEVSPPGRRPADPYKRWDPSVQGEEHKTNTVGAAAPAAVSIGAFLFLGRGFLGDRAKKPLIKSVV